MVKYNGITFEQKNPDTAIKDEIKFCPTVWTRPSSTHFVWSEPNIEGKQ